MSTTNSAALLHRCVAHIHGGRADRLKAREILATIFGLNAEDDVELRRFLLALDEAFERTENQIRSIAGAKPEFYLRHFRALRSGFAKVNLDQPSSSAFHFLNDAAVENLAAAAVRVGEGQQEVEISEAELKDLSTSVGELLEWVVSSEVDPDLKEVCIELLEALRRAVLEYRVRGVDGLRHAVEEAFGKLSFYRWRKGESVDKSSFKRVWQVVVKAEGILSRALTYSPFLEDGLKRLLGAG